MSIYTPDEAMLRTLSKEIEAIPPRPHHSALLEIANRLMPDRTFRQALDRGGWYRSGGIISADGTRVADNVEAWARSELERHGDVPELIEYYADSELLVTRHTGRTHYFVAAYGPAPADFLQLEVEELQEVLDRKLINANTPPEDLQELIEPMSPVEVDAQAVGAPRYRFRRLIDMRLALPKVSLSENRNTTLPRFLAEWADSSAATRGHFSDHWLVALREHQDRYRNSVLSASLISRKARALKPFQWNTALSGVELSSQLQAFDRTAGYPSAWYFHLIATTLTPRVIAYAVAKDLDSGFSYLPEAEVTLIKNWVATPYSV